MLLSGLQGCAVYLDDVVMYSNTWEEHLDGVKALFDRLVWANLTVNLPKCDFAKATVTYLDKIVGHDQGGCYLGLSCSSNQSRTYMVSWFS